jgi:4-cresol dehydrogenase (hydroxylating)
MNTATSSLTSQTANVTGREHAVGAVHRPATTQEVLKLVAQARKTQTPLYPVSTGFNWGYGSASPAVAGCDLVDLSGMNRILNADEISLSNPVAVIEPGVTQGQLYDFLQKRCPELTFNVSGSSRGTSILGNALDRGVGYFGPRKEDVFGLEVVCGSGKLLKTGFRRLGEDSPLAHSHPYGLGPILDGLFFQGNFGIVTSGCFKLTPRRPKEVAVTLALYDSAKLGEFIDEMAHLKREGLLVSVTHIANSARSHSSMMYGMCTYLEKNCGMPAQEAYAAAEKAIKLVAPNEWTSLGAVTGNKGQVSAALGEIKSRMRKLARVTVVSNGLLDLGYAVMNTLRFIPQARALAASIAALRPLHNLSVGVPTDVAIDNLMWKYGRSEWSAEKLDQTNCGWIFISPALPSDGKVVASLLTGMTAVAAKHGHKLYTTVNIETSMSLVAVINLAFDRSKPEEVKVAHACADELLQHIHSQKLSVYRARADSMPDIVSQDPAYWKIVRGLKSELDPDNIIAPGRYNLAN